MKISLTILDGEAQIGLQPENGIEGNILELVSEGKTVTIRKGNILAHTNGGYVRPFNERPAREATLIVFETQQPGETDNADT